MCLVLTVSFDCFQHSVCFEEGKANITHDPLKLSLSISQDIRHVTPKLLTVRNETNDKNKKQS